MNRYIIVMSGLLVVMIGQLVLPAANVPAQKARTITPLPVPRSSGSVADVSQSMRPAALATQTPKIELKNSPGSLAGSLFALPSAQAGSHRIGSVQSPVFEAEDIPTLELSESSSRASAAESFQEGQPQRSMRATAFSLTEKPAQKQLSSLSGHTPKALAALKEVEKPHAVLSSKMTSALAPADLSYKLKGQVSDLVTQMEEEKINKKDIQDPERLNVLNKMAYTSSEIVRIVQRIEKHPLNANEIQQLEHLFTCVDSMRSIFDTVKQEMHTIKDISNSLFKAQLDAIEASNPIDLDVPGVKEATSLKKLFLVREDLRFVTLRLKHNVELIKQSLSKLKNQLDKIKTVRVIDEA